MLQPLKRCVWVIQYMQFKMNDQLYMYASMSQVWAISTFLEDIRVALVSLVLSIVCI